MGQRIHRLFTMQKLQGKAARFQREQPVVKLTFVLQRNEVENNQNEQ